MYARLRHRKPKMRRLAGVRIIVRRCGRHAAGRMARGVWMENAGPVETDDALRGNAQPFRPDVGCRCDRITAGTRAARSTRGGRGGSAKICASARYARPLGEGRVSEVREWRGR
jgi:hypothetical protein